MAILIERVKPVAKQIIQFLLLKVEYFRERLEGYFGAYRVDTEHVYSQKENELIDQSAEIVQQFFPDPPGSSLLQEDFESRCQVLEDLAARLIQAYELNDVDVIITGDPDVFPENCGTLGMTIMQDKTVYLNANFLGMDNEMVLERIVSTVIHELRHVMQYEIMTLENTRGVPYQRRKAWRYTTYHYVSPSLDREAYVKQSIEFDARNFANRVWQGAYRKNVPLGGH